jgi:hypothetical protein
MTILAWHLAFKDEDYAFARPAQAPPAAQLLDDFIRRAEDLADLDVVVQERDGLFPVGPPQLGDGRVGLAPLLFELLERCPRSLRARSGVDRAQVFGDGFPVPFGGVPEGAADQVHDAGLDDRGGEDSVHAVRQPLEAVTDWGYLPLAGAEEHVGDAAVLQFGEHAHPELRGLPAAVARP